MTIRMSSTKHFIEKIHANLLTLMPVNALKRTCTLGNDIFIDKNQIKISSKLLTQNRNGCTLQYVGAGMSHIRFRLTPAGNDSLFTSQIYRRCWQTDRQNMIPTKWSDKFQGAMIFSIG